MKIDEFLHKIKIDNFKSIEKILEQSNNNLKKENSTKNFGNKNNAKLNINQNIINLLNNLNTEEKKLLLNTLLKLELPLNEKNLRLLINLMNNKEVNIKNDSLIKAMGILQKSGLALNYNLIEGISQNLDSSTSQTEILTDIINNNSYLLNILNDLIIDPSLEKSELTDQLRDYLSNLYNLEDILVNNQNKSEKENELFRQLLGQKIINKEKNNILLSIEIPINWPKNDDIIPLYLEILKEENYKNKNDKNNEYKIAFNIDLNEKGLIYAYLKIKNKNIKAYFKSNNEKTLKIIENNKNKLKENIQNIGYNFSLKVQNEKEKLLKEKNSLDFFLENNNNKELKNESYQHIDIKV